MHITFSGKCYSRDASISKVCKAKFLIFWKMLIDFTLFSFFENNSAIDYTVDVGYYEPQVTPRNQFVQDDCSLNNFFQIPALQTRSLSPIPYGKLKRNWNDDTLTFFLYCDQAIWNFLETENKSTKLIYRYSLPFLICV